MTTIFFLHLGKLQPAKVGNFQSAETGEYSTGVDSQKAVASRIEIVNALLQGYPSHLPSAGESCRRAYPDRVSCLLPPGHAQEPIADPCTRPDPHGSAGETRHDSDDRRLYPDTGRTLADPASLHATGQGSAGRPRPNPTHAAIAAATPHYRAGSRRSSGPSYHPAPSVVKTFR